MVFVLFVCDIDARGRFISSEEHILRLEERLKALLEDHGVIDANQLCKLCRLLILHIDVLSLLIRARFREIGQFGTGDRVRVVSSWQIGSLLLGDAGMAKVAG